MNEKIKYQDFPFDEIVDAAIEKMDEGWTVFQKWTCSGEFARGNSSGK
jgi:hypothetical protein